METETAQNLKTKIVNVDIDDISSAGSSWVVPGIAGTIKKVTTVLYGAITTGDAVVTLEIGGVLVTGSSVTIANAGSAAGDVDSATPSALNVVTAIQPIEVITDGGSTVAQKVTVTLEIEPS